MKISSKRAIEILREVRPHVSRTSLSDFVRRGLILPNQSILASLFIMRSMFVLLLLN